MGIMLPMCCDRLDTLNKMPENDIQCTRAYLDMTFQRNKCTLINWFWRRWLLMTFNSNEAAYIYVNFGAHKVISWSIFKNRE